MVIHLMSFYLHIFHFVSICCNLNSITLIFSPSYFIFCFRSFKKFWSWCMTSSLSCTRTTVVNEVNLYAFYLVLHRHSEDCVFPLLCSFLTISSDYHHYTVIVLICSLCYHESVVRIVKISSL